MAQKRNNSFLKKWLWQLILLRNNWSSLVAQNTLAMQEIQVWFLDGEDTLEKEMATHSSIPAWEISWTGESGRLLSMVSQRVGHNLATDFHFQRITSLVPTVLTANLSLKGEYCFYSFGWYEMENKAIFQEFPE